MQEWRSKVKTPGTLSIKFRAQDGRLWELTDQRVSAEHLGLSKCTDLITWLYLLLKVADTLKERNR